MMILPRIAIVIQTLRVTSCAEFSEKTDPQKALASVCVSEKQGASREHPHSDDSVGVVESVPACIPTEAKPRISFERSSRSELVLDSALYPYKFDSQTLGGPAIVTKVREHAHAPHSVPGHCEQFRNKPYCCLCTGLD